MKFEFASPTRVIFGPGKIRDTVDIIRPHGTKPLLVTGSHPERAASLLERLKSAGLQVITHPTEGEPTLETIERGVRDCRAAHCDLVLGYGGGSALDAAKAIAAMATNPGAVTDYLEVIGRGQPLRQSPLPFIAIPTTAGTGSEVTRNAVLGSPEHQVKVSLRSPKMLARAAIVDPELTLDLPPSTTASTGMDALTQCIEAYVSCKATPLTDAFSLQGIRSAARALPAVFRDGRNLEARTDMALASLCSGIALANAGLGAVHGFAGPIGGMFPAPHGAICAALLPHVMQANLKVLRARDPDHPSLQRFEEIARLLSGKHDATAEEGIQWLDELQKILGIPRLAEWSVHQTDMDAIVEKAAAASSMKGNPITLDETELRAILAAAL